MYTWCVVARSTVQAVVSHCGARTSPIVCLCYDVLFILIGATLFKLVNICCVARRRRSTRHCCGARHSTTMNIFFLHVLATLSAADYCDKHVNKIAIEITQMVWMAWRHVENAGNPATVKRYRANNYNHPMAVWVRMAHANYLYAIDLGLELIKEFYKRRVERAKIKRVVEKPHACEVVLQWLRDHLPPHFGLDTYVQQPYLATVNVPPNCTPVPLCMPPALHCDDLIQAYRNYYMSEDKAKIATWNYSEKPEWYTSSPLAKKQKL